MKSLFLVLLIILFTGSAMAVDVISDPCIDCVSYDMEINGAIVGNKLALEADKSIKYNVDGLSVGAYTFKVRCYSAEGWPSAWSVPFGAAKPGSPGNVRLRP